ncbi:MAG: hypothetical protein OXN84_00485 [Albidovulum sp.]|nr:hypothetical protein [Albidovulum sp.]
MTLGQIVGDIRCNLVPAERRRLNAYAGVGSQDAPRYRLPGRIGSA